MASVIYGATLAEWEAFSQLDLPNVLPYVADPDVPTHPGSKVKAANKTPSYVYTDSRGVGVMGFKAWNDPNKRTTSTHDWQRDNKLGICLRTQTIKAIDIDVPEVAVAKEIEAYIRETLGIAGFELPVRTRANSGKRALLYRLIDEQAISKYFLHVDKNKGIIEFLGDKQHICVAGGHPEGGRYLWPDGIPTKLSDIPAVEFAQILELTRKLAEDFGPTGWYREWRYKSEYTPRTYKADAFDEHESVKHIIENDWFVDYAVNGGIYVRCPWAKYHSKEGNATEAEFFPAGTNGQKDHGFKCMHAHSLAPGGPFAPTASEFLAIIGYQDKETAADFSALAPVDNDKPIPAMTRPKFSYKGKSSQIEAVLPNVIAMLGWEEGTGFEVRYDRFKDTILVRQHKTHWKALTDETYTEMRLAMMRVGMEQSLSKELIRDSIHFVASQNDMDSAQEWLNSLQWDGRSRVAEFHKRVLKLADDPYHVAVSLYLWTALAGRVIEPGCKADMVPILTGPQGLRKSSLVEALAPGKDEYTVVSLADRDENLARQLRGRMVVEWDELRGLNTRDAESIKGWVSRTKDDWIPKFKEFATSLPRRYLLLGTANPKQFLSDPTGLRRWLPLFITHTIDVDLAIREREQLWAEAKALYHKHYEETKGRSGVMYEDAERLALASQKRASIRDPWVDAINLWIEQEDRTKGATTLQILHQACSISTSQITYGTHERLRRTMAYIGWSENENGLWEPPLA
jgi:hypothetical protein